MTVVNVNNTAIRDYYDYLFIELADERVHDWFLMQSPFPVLIIVSLYMYFVLSLGPKFMQNSKPFDLDKTVMLYNTFQVLLSAWIFVESMDGAWLNKYSLKCEPIDRTRSLLGMRAARGVYIFFLAKISELLDTVFFVLRKKQKQITFLHMYHHSLMPIAAWIITKYAPGGHGIFIGSINSFVHILMYTYYLLAGMGPDVQKYLWWKKYVTTLQLVQFCVGTLHAAQLLFYDCGYPRWTLVLFLPNGIFFYFLFNDFYKKTYQKGNTSSINHIKCKTC